MVGDDQPVVGRRAARAGRWRTGSARRGRAEGVVRPEPVADQAGVGREGGVQVLIAPVDARCMLVSTGGEYGCAGFAFSAACADVAPRPSGRAPGSRPREWRLPASRSRRDLRALACGCSWPLLRHRGLTPRRLVVPAPQGSACARARRECSTSATATGVSSLPAVLVQPPCPATDERRRARHSHPQVVSDRAT